MALSSFTSLAYSSQPSPTMDVHEFKKQSRTQLKKLPINYRAFPLPISYVIFLDASPRKRFKQHFQELTAWD